MSNQRNSAPNHVEHVVIEFPLTPAIAARRYWTELERVDRLEYETGRHGRINRRTRADYYRLCCEPWPGQDRQ